MNWTTLDTQISVLATLSALVCALPGCFLVLRRMSMMGDAISHAVLPGLALAFLFSGNRSSLGMFLGAAAVGVLTAILVDAIHRYGQVEESASMGVVFTAMFAVGLLLMVRAADQVDLDPSCVLYGALEVAPLDTVLVLGWKIPRVSMILTAALVLNLTLLLAFTKELVLATFDPGLAETQGISPRWVNFGLMATVAVTAVAAFEAVGSILVIAMLVVPAATAQLLTTRLPGLLLVAGGVACLSAWLGHLLAITLPPLLGYEDTSTAGMMAVVSGMLFFLAALFAPGRGVLSRLLSQTRLRFRIKGEDILGFLYRCRELGEPALAGEEQRIEKLLLLAPWERGLVMWRLQTLGLVMRTEGHWVLTEPGAERARHLVRSHRIWEMYLHQELRTPLERVHQTAHLLEHSTKREHREQLERELGHPEVDPHGRMIPPE